MRDELLGLVPKDYDIASDARPEQVQQLFRRTLAIGASFGVVESVKAVSDLFAPVSGEVAEVNADLSSSPELLNSDPFGAGWIAKITLADSAEMDKLLDAAAYAELTAG